MSDEQLIIQKEQVKAGFAPAPVWIEVDLNAIQKNLRQVQRFVGDGVRTMAVIKANAYGHGLMQVAEALVKGGVDQLGVASVIEGVALRRHGLTLPIAVLGQLLPEEAELVAGHHLVQAIGDEQSARVLSQAACSLERPVSVQLKIDTGMGRYGVWYEEAEDLFRHIARLPGLNWEGVFSHFAMAGQSIEATAVQIERFSQVVERLKAESLPVPMTHLSNSVGLIRFPRARLDLVRTGLLIYGISPIRDGRLPIPLEPALFLKSRIRFIKTIPAGQTVSYGGTYRVNRPTQVATIPVGYAHGYLRALSNRAQVLVGGQRVPVIGRVTMEDLTIDVTDVPNVQVGHEVVLIGRQGNEQVTSGELARHAQTIPYEILAGLSQRIPRRYLEVNR